MRRALACTCFASVIALAVVTARPSADNDISIVNARVFTGVAAAPWAEAVRIEGDRITLVGTTAVVRGKTTSATRVIDAGGRLVIPGINDAHAHPDILPAHTALDAPPAMTEDPSWPVTLERVKAAVARTPAGGWIIGEIGAAVLDDPAATRVALDPLTADRPVMLGAWHGHGVIFNTAALRRLGVSETEADPPGGMFARTADGKLTGLAHEYADYALRQRVTMSRSEAEQAEGFRQFAREAASFGITSIQAMMTGYRTDKAAATIAKADLPVRMRLIDFPLVAPSHWWGAVRGPESSRLTISGVKYVLDGTPIERFMLLRAPYADAPGTRGRLNFSEQNVRSFLAMAASARVQPMFHATGDAAIDTVLTALDAVQVTPPQPGSIWKDLRPRIEHGDMFEPAHIERAKRHGVVIVQNPAHFMVGPTMKARLGARVRRATMVKTIVSSGVPFAIGSDGPMNPFLNIMFATINEVNPGEALTVEQALAAYTRGSAYGEFAEKMKGTIAPGMLADLAILSQDIFKVPGPDLPKTTSVLTIVGGTVVHGTM